jgi:hypothetical protein
MGDRRGGYMVLEGRPEGKIPLDRPRHRWIILNCVFKKWDGDVDWIARAQDRDRWRDVVNAVMNLRVP